MAPVVVTTTSLRSINGQYDDWENNFDMVLTFIFNSENDDGGDVPTTVIENNKCIIRVLQTSTDEMILMHLWKTFVRRNRNTRLPLAWHLEVCVEDEGVLAVLNHRYNAHLNSVAISNVIDDQFQSLRKSIMNNGKAYVIYKPYSNEDVERVQHYLSFPRHNVDVPHAIEIV